MTIAVGAARVAITPQQPCHLAGYGARDHASEGVHDPLHLRALWAEGTDGTPALLISADILWFGRQVADRIRAEAQTELGLPPARVFLAGTHTHSAPCTAARGNEEWTAALVDRALAAAALARGRIRPARLRLHRGASHIGINRREQRPGGEVVLGQNPDGPIDRELLVVAVDGGDGRPVARLVNFACHGVVMDDVNYRVSGDWPGFAAGLLERRLECPFLFLNGGAGNVNSRVGPQGDFAPMEALAEEFAANCLAALKRRGKPLDAGDGVLSGIETSLALPRKPGEIERGKGRLAPVTLHGLRIGGVCLAGYPGEMFSETAMAVKQAAPRPATLVCSYVHGGDAGYVPVREAYDTGGYEVGASPYSEAAEPVLRAGLVELCARLDAGGGGAKR